MQPSSLLLARLRGGVMDGVCDRDKDCGVWGVEWGVDKGIKWCGSGDVRPVADKLLGERASRKVDMAIPSTNDGLSGSFEGTGGELCKGLFVSWTVGSAVLRGGVRAWVGATFTPRLLCGRLGEF